MNDAMHDDGLVHGHAWATEPPRPARPAMVIRAVEPHDDGLVHEHRWACGERGRKAHRDT
jgi:hypothetical protein